MARQLQTSFVGKLLQVHHDLAKYHEMGRFILPGSDDSPDLDVALFHERQAAELGVKEAVITMANIYLQRSRDVLASITVDVSKQHRDCVYDVMQCEFKN